MTGEQKNIDHLFRNGLNGMREKPPRHAWDRLDRALDGQIRRKKMFYFKLAAASALILLAFGAGFFYATILNKPADFAGKGVLNEPPPAILLPDSSGTSSIQPAIPESQQVELSNLEDREAPDADTEKEQGFQGRLAMTDQEPAVHSDHDLLAVDVSNPLQEPVAHPAIHTLAFIKVTELESSKLYTEPAMIGKAATEKTIYSYNGFYPLDNYDDRPEQKGKRWVIGAQFAPTQSYRDISVNYNANSFTNQGLEDNLNDAEEALLSYAGGVNVDYNFSGKWSVQSGMYYSRIGQVNNDALQYKQSNNEILLIAINTSTGRIDFAIERVPDDVRKLNNPKDTIDMGGLNSVKVIQNFDLFEVPLVVKYKFLNKRFSMNLSGGLSPAYLLGNNTYLEMEDRKYDIGDAGNLNSMIVNTSFGLGMEYLVTKKLSVNFEPTFKYSLSPINSNSDFSYHPYYFSWFTGIRLRIN